MAWCTEARKCAGMRLSTRITEGDVDTAASPGRGSLLQRLHYNYGTWSGYDTNRAWREREEMHEQASF